MLLLNNSNARAALNNIQLYTKNIFLNIFLFLFFVIFLSGSTQARTLEKSVIEEEKFEGNDLYLALTAEIYNKFDKNNLAVDFYYELSVNNNDPAIAKRVTELATLTGQIAKALQGAIRWVELEPDNLEANQYLALLYLRNSDFTSAAQQLDSIRSFIENSSDNVSKYIINNSQASDVVKKGFQSSESLTFIGALLAAESHHEKAFMVFNLYIKKYASKILSHKLYIKQQRLIAAQLAMKAKKYQEVANYLGGLSGLDDKNHVDAKVMQAKALHKLGQNTQAIQHLRSIQNNSEANDSHRLELVRLLVLNKQKSMALSILESLVTKHPKNLDLLKSLIAIKIDLSKLSTVDSDIKRLSASKNYVNVADYFSGEFAEKLGQQEKALLSFSKVTGGSYLKNAQKKIIRLLKIIEGPKALNAFFMKQQKNAGSINDQAYWIKLQADDLFEAGQYKEALNLYSKAIRLAPKKSRYRYKRGLANERIGKLKNAESDFNYVLAIRANDVEVLNALGYMLSVHTERLTEAKELISKAHKLKPNDPLVLDSLGFVLYKTGELDQAEKYLRKAFHLARKPEVASHLITVLVKSNQHQEAKNIYLEMRSIYPNSPSLKSVYKHLH